MKTNRHSFLPSTESFRGKFATRRARFGAAYGSFVGLVLLLLSPHVVRAECSNWDVSGTWEIKQSNGYSITVVVVKKSSGFEVTSPTGGGGLGSGNVSGNDFFMEIGWYGLSNDGVYRGKISSSGRISGTTYDAVHPESKAKWFSASVMKCADAAPSAPAATPKPIKSSGYKSGTTQLPVVPGSGSGTAGGFIQMHTPAPTPRPARTGPTQSAEADESSSNDTEDQQGKHKKNKKKKKHHHHDDDENQDQGND